MLIARLLEWNYFSSFDAFDINFDRLYISFNSNEELCPLSSSNLRIAECMSVLLSSIENRKLREEFGKLQANLGELERRIEVEERRLEEKIEKKKTPLKEDSCSPLVEGTWQEKYVRATHKSADSTSSKEVRAPCHMDEEDIFMLEDEDRSIVAMCQVDGTKEEERVAAMD
ncbi:hypothetical protein SUGI_0941090 [Cryptomeria japonica]|nr:hypothetical protein SUGI_0941090 [Cryptomeria japonica]